MTLQKKEAPASASIEHHLANQILLGDFNADEVGKSPSKWIHDIIQRLPDAPLCSGIGQHHTNNPGAKNPKPYQPITLAEVFKMAINPASVSKAHARWLIPSSLISRSFKLQEAQGEYYALWFDFDENPKPLAEVLSVWRRITGQPTLTLSYMTSSATSANPKSRLLIPLAHPLSGSDWSLMQCLINDALESEGLTPDRANERAAQIFYLPNRGEHYEWLVSDGALCDAQKDFGAELRIKRAKLMAAKHEADKRKQESRERRQNRLQELANGAPLTPIEWYNQTHSIDEILLANGYDHDGVDRYRHPASATGSFSARVWRDGDRERVSTLSTRDPLYCENGAAHDAFSALVELKFDGDRNCALELVRQAQTLSQFVDLTPPAPLSSSSEDQAERNIRAQDTEALDGGEVEEQAALIDEPPLPTMEPYPGVMSDVVKAICQTAWRPQPMLSIGATLAGMAAGCPGIYRLEDGGRLNLYVLGISPSGTGKEHPRACAELLAHAAGARVMGAPGSGEGLEDSIPEEPTQAMLMSVDEAGHWLGVVEDSNAPPQIKKLAKVVLELFSRGSSKYFSRALAKKAGGVYNNPTLSMMACSTPERLGEALSLKSIESGLMGRLLVVRGDVNVQGRDVTKQFELPLTAVATARSLQEQASDLGKDIEYRDIVVRWMPNAMVMARDIRHAFEDTRLTGYERTLQMRSYELAKRIAGVLAVWDDPVTPSIKVDHLSWANQFVRMSCESMLWFINRYMHEGKIQADAAAVLDLCKRIVRQEISTERSNEFKAIKEGKIPQALVLRRSKLSALDMKNALLHLEMAGDIETKAIAVEGVAKPMSVLELRQ